MVSLHTPALQVTRVAPPGAKVPADDTAAP
jgi:hypothetical protein